MKIIIKLISSLLVLVCIATGIAFAIPKSREYICDYLSQKFSPKYQEQVDTNSSLTSELETKNAELTRNKSLLATAQSEKVFLQSQLTQANSDKVALTARINELNATIADIIATNAEIEGYLEVANGKVNTSCENVDTLYTNCKAIAIREETEEEVINQIMTECGLAIASPSEDKVILASQKLTAIKTFGTNMRDGLDELSTDYQALQNNYETLQADYDQKLNDLAALQANYVQSQSDLTSARQNLEVVQNELATANQTILNLQNQIITLNTQISTQQTRIEELQAQVSDLQLELSVYDVCCINIDQTNAVESITVQDIKLNTTSTIANTTITSLSLYSWQNVIIKYLAVENSTIVASLNGIAQTTDTVIVNGSDYKNQTINIASIIQEPVVNNIMKCTYVDGSVKNVEVNENLNSSVISDKSVLKSVIIPNIVTRIDDSTFSDCKVLISITIPNSVTSIRDYAFSNCIGLTSITIPNSVTSIGIFAFCDCIGLTSINVDSSNITYKSVDNCLLYKAGTQLILGCKNSIIPSTVTSIEAFAFSNCIGLTSITIPNSLTSIGYHAFAGCLGLTSIVIPGNVIGIGDYAFSGCSGLTSIVISSNESYNIMIGANAFEDCTGLTSITIPNSVSDIGANAFDGCSGLTSITILDCVSMDDEVFLNCDSLNTINFNRPQEEWVKEGYDFSYLTQQITVNCSDGQLIVNG